MRPGLLLVLLALPLMAAGPGTTFNDDSCDIGLFPAATLLLPYFEVAGEAGGETTIFTVTNVSHLPQAARVTLWTDYGFPVLSFNLYLTGYDVQSVNLFDVIYRGLLATPNGTGSLVSPVGELSGTNSFPRSFDNPQLSEASCSTAAPVQVAQGFIIRMVRAFTTGSFPPLGPCRACSQVGGTHVNATGYVTIDLVGSCGNAGPTDVAYFREDIRHDNVLIGDYVQIDGTNDYAQGNPMVHIRAIPDGSSAETPATFARTFYSHLQPADRQTADRRQPLPSLFAARWIDGGPSGYETFFKIWRGVETPARAACADYASNAAMYAAEVVRFDEEENPTLLGLNLPWPVPHDFRLSATSRRSVRDPDLIPPNASEDVGGWIYFNLHNDDPRTTTVAGQNWVVVSMRAAGRYSIDSDAISLGNGCTPAKLTISRSAEGSERIGPAPDRP